MLKNNSTVKVISIILAVCLWAFVIGEVNPTIKTTIADVPIELTNVDTLPDRGLALSSDEEYFTDVVVKGSRSEVNALKASDIHATADLYGYNKGENTITIEVVLPDGIDLEEVKSPEITVMLEKMESVYLPVKVEFTGETDEHLEASVISQVPAEVEVRGAASVVKTVTDVRVQIDVEDLSETSDVYAAVPTAWNEDGKLVKNVNISAQSVDVEAVLYHTKRVQLIMKVTGSPDSENGEAEVTVPDEITVKGTSENLQRVTSVTASSVDISDVTKDTTVKIEPELPSGIQLADSSKDIGIKIEFK